MRRLRPLYMTESFGVWSGCIAVGIIMVKLLRKDLDVKDDILIQRVFKLNTIFFDILLYPFDPMLRNFFQMFCIRNKNT